MEVVAAFRYTLTLYQDLNSANEHIKRENIRLDVSKVFYIEGIYGEEKKLSKIVF